VLTTPLNVFQSARVLADARRCRVCLVRHLRSFNPRASSRTRDLALASVQAGRTVFQSARVLADARRSAKVSCISRKCFNPRASSRTRDFNFTRSRTSDVGFNPRASSRTRDDNNMVVSGAPQRFNPRASSRTRDPQFTCLPYDTRSFNPRASSRTRDGRPLWQLAGGTLVSIRARPRGRATDSREISWVWVTVFQSARVLADARHAAGFKFGGDGFVSIRARPRGRATGERILRTPLSMFQSARVLADARPLRCIVEVVAEPLFQSARVLADARHRCCRCGILGWGFQSARVLADARRVWRRRRGQSRIVSIRARPRGRATPWKCQHRRRPRFQSARVLADARRGFSFVFCGF